jgi:outer membrane protein insertion porin family
MGLGVRLLRGLALSCLVLAGVLVGGGAATIATATSAVARTANSIVVEGNRRVDADTVRSYFHAGPNGRLSPVEIDAGLKALYATGLFSDIRIRHAGGRLIVSVVENPVINKVAFEGNHKAKDKQLQAEVQSKARGTLSKPAVQADVQRIIAIYNASGYFNVTVTPQIIRLPNNRVNLVFKIKEGGKTGVADIRFVGAHAFSSWRLKRVIKTSVSGWFSFLQTTDIYDPDRVEADRDLLRRFYLKHGYADVRITSASGVYDPKEKGFIVTFKIDEGPKYHIGTVQVVSNVHAMKPSLLRGDVQLGSGDVYNADLVQKSVESMTIEAAKHGYAFAQVIPHGQRDYKKRLINLTFLVSEGRRAYIERIDIHGNTRTRGYVIRREFDIGEGDPYNRALINRAERRLKNLDFFKSVKITTEPGSTPDRVIVNVNVVEKPTGNFAVSGGYSTADGFISQVSVAERNLDGRGIFAKASVTYGQHKRGFGLSLVEPYLFGYRMSGGVDLYLRQNLANSYVSYDTKTYGANFRLGFQLTENLSLQPRYSIYRQEISFDTNSAYNNCVNSAAAVNFRNGIGSGVQPGNSCYSDGEAALAVRKELAQGPVWVSMAGYTVAYNTLDNNKSPTSGLFASFKQDVAGLGGDVNFIRSTVSARQYYEVLPDVVGMLKLQGGNVAPWGGKDLRMLDHFFMGPNLVRGFAPSGIGPRDLTAGSRNDALGGSLYWGASLEFQTPLYFLPKQIGIKVAAFADAGSLWGYKGSTYWDQTGETLKVGLDSPGDIRSSVGAGLIWDSPLGPLRFDVAYPLTKACGTATDGSQICDKTQIFRFSGGTSF